MRGLISITQALQTKAAHLDYQFLADFAANNGHADTAAKLAPLPEYGWRRVDKQISKLRNVLTEAGLNVPALPSTGGN